MRVSATAPTAGHGRGSREEAGGGPLHPKAHSDAPHPAAGARPGPDSVPLRTHCCPRRRRPGRGAAVGTRPRPAAARPSRISPHRQRPSWRARHTDVAAAPPPAPLLGGDAPRRHDAFPPAGEGGRDSACAEGGRGLAAGWDMRGEDQRTRGVRMRARAHGCLPAGPEAPFCPMPITPSNYWRQ